MPVVFYDPDPLEIPLSWLMLRETLEGAIAQAGLYTVGDWALGQLQPWGYYAGVAAGNLAAATGIPGGAATLYIVGDVFDTYILKSEKGSNVRIFLNGVAAQSIQTYAVATVWELVQINISDALGRPPIGTPEAGQYYDQYGSVTRVDIVNDGPDPAHPDPAQSYFMGIGFPFAARTTLEGTVPKFLGRGLRASESVWEICFVIEDGHRAKAKTTIHYPGAASYDQVRAYAEAVRAVMLPNITGGIVGVTIAHKIPLPGGIKTAPHPGSDVSEKMRFKLLTLDNHKVTHSVPTWTELYTRVDPEKELRFVDTQPNVQAYLDVVCRTIYADKRGDLIKSWSEGKATWHGS